MELKLQIVTVLKGCSIAYLRRENECTYEEEGLSKIKNAKVDVSQGGCKILLFSSFLHVGFMQSLRILGKSCIFAAFNLLRCLLLNLPIKIRGLT